MKIKNLLTILVLSGLGISSCKKSQLSSDSGNSNLSLVSEEKQHQSKLEFGQALAVSLKNKELRDMIKSEALKQFDNDYDVLFANIMDRKLSSGETVIEFIASKSGNSSELIKNIGDLPLLNIFVPELENFSAGKWSTDSQIPTVAVLREKDKRDGKQELIAFDENKKSIKLSYSIVPTTPIVVIKNNERIEISGSANNNKLAGTKTESNSGFQSNITSKYSFISSAFDGTQKSSNKSYTTMNTDRGSGDRGETPSSENYIDNSQQISDLGIRYAYEKKLNTQRDYLYYGIDSTKNITTGKFNNQYGEHIVSIELENLAYLKKITDDWTEGDLEIIINTIMIQRDGSPLTKKTGITCKSSDLKETYKTREGTLAEQPIVFNKFRPIIIDSWDAYKYGDKWKFVVYEYDNGEKTTSTQTVSSEFSTNFGATAGFNIGIVKFGANAGGGTKETKSTTTVIESTNNSDDLYEGILNFATPVYSRLFTTSGRVDRDGKPQVYITPKEFIVSTGAIRLNIQPLKTF